VTILLGWTCYVVSLSHSGKRAIQAAKDAFHAVADDNSAKTKLSGEGMGVMRAMAGSEWCLEFGVSRSASNSSTPVAKSFLTGSCKLVSSGPYSIVRWHRLTTT
jgi:hypothetical protein